MTKDDKRILWWIGGGLFGLAVLAPIAEGAMTAWQQRRAVDQLMEVASHPDPLGFRAQAEADRTKTQRREDAERRRAAEAARLKPGEKCIDGLRFRRLPNGFEQIGTC